MKLTKLQRHTAYVIMLSESEIVLDNWVKGERTDHSLCSTIGGLCDIITHVLHENIDNPLEDFGLSELISKKPPLAHMYWFFNDYHGWLERIKLLNECIKETY